MQKFETVTAIAAPLQRANVDTDQILPGVYLRRITKTGFEDALFQEWRQDEDFVLNQERYSGAQILVAGPDFGTGSSREHAVWALRDFGFRVVLSSRFGDIFRGNAGKQGLLAAVVSDAVIERLWQIIEDTVGRELTVDLVTRTVTAGGETFDFEIDGYTRWRLMEGLDDIGLTLRNEALISEFETRRESWRPKTLPVI
ncbi:3-isopropylmalate dehydratase small subunit [Rathayibacter toxicus]|uniref:3-isopropylmalate dehydratase small subunit n=1 Tax=Rathayibacter toxicus TaxID=145458 RepID=A0A0C5BHU3_9MICO|nr:3-isopropylmalate dehydratase small subunit [Rathayibacter toxicus]AJM77850.1 isopropylmalate isomerase [Rathayibacter toxicus]ALS57962.1 isopropylmalate isomerase [Rathayibacter toxicus]KKM44323.1 isopropylmalate isomerase [Rathayibacter toxicus]PPG20353.1 3-isopropylmalate dehydratase small subunit [Rathayibacter toxicus]PPG45454.1 3-isopropylmalate dehydratase small subunit [Rathayibacter toxicus]